MIKISKRNSHVKTRSERLSARHSQAYDDIAAEELGAAPAPREPREIPLRKAAARRIYTGHAPVDDWARVRKTLQQSRPADLGGGVRHPDRTDNLACALKDKQAIRAMLHLLGIHDTARALSEKPFQFLDQNGKSMGPVRLSKTKDGQYTFLVIPPTGNPIAMSLGTAYAKRVLGAPHWPFVLKSHVETRLWCGRLVIESDPGFERTPLPVLTNEDFVRAATQKGQNVNPLGIFEMH